MKRRIPIHLKAVLVFLVAILCSSVMVPLVSAAIPGQLYRWYVVTTLVVILLYVSTSEAVLEEFVVPFRASCWDVRPSPSHCVLSSLSFLPLLLGWYFSSWVAGGSSNHQGGLRVIHPTPPASVSFKGKRIGLKEVPDESATRR